MSQWGNNFRPSYLRVRSLLPLIKPKSILALTATAGPTVVRDICHTLGIPFDRHGLDSGDCLASPSMLKTSGVKVLSCDRDNIDVFSIILQSNDERRYLVSVISYSRLLTQQFSSLSHICWILFIAPQNIEGEEYRLLQLQKTADRGRLLKQRQCYHLRMETEGY